MTLGRWSLRAAQASVLALLGLVGTGQTMRLRHQLTDRMDDTLALVFLADLVVAMIALVCGLATWRTEHGRLGAGLILFTALLVALRATGHLPDAVR